MTERQNLFRPIHKGIRSMLYESGTRLQRMDFADVAASNAFVDDLKHDLGASLSNCLLCLISIHAKHEERDIFAKLRVHDSEAVDLVMKEHAELTRRIHDVAKLCDALPPLSDPKARIELGYRLELDANELFTSYMSHLNHEEDWVVPVMWQWFTDDELNAMRAVFYNNLPLPLFETWMRWAIPAMNPEELLVFMRGMASDPAPNRLADALRVARAVLPPARWEQLRVHFEGVVR